MLAIAGRRVASWTVAVLATWSAGAAATPYVPARDDEVLLRLPPRSSSTRPDVFSAVSSGADQLAAAALAATHIQRARQSGDPRHFGKAAAALAPFAEEKELVPALLRARGAVSAFEHQFASAIADYQAFLAFEPQDDDVRFSLAVLQQITGDFDAARASCKALVNPEAALRELCLANADVAALSWSSAEGHLAAFDAVADTRDVAPEWRAYAAELRAWYLAARGKHIEAKAAFSSALSFPNTGNVFAADYRLASYMDFLLATGDIEGAKAAASSVELSGRASIALAVRRVLALRAAGEDEAAASGAAELDGDWLIERVRGDGRHWREVALYELYVRGNGAAALAAATDNWRNGQREPLDGALLIAAAEAVRRPEAADEVRNAATARGVRSDDLRIFLPKVSK